MSKKVAVVLAGCGQRDGSEIHESVLTILGIVKAGAEALFFAPTDQQRRVFDHAAQKAVAGDRNMLTEAARIARGEISDIKRLTCAVADAVIFPGGAGASWNLSDFGLRGAEFSVHPEAERVIREFYTARKPLGFICIAPLLAAKVLGSFGVELTIGSDPEVAGFLQSCGAKAIVKRANEAHVDKVHRVVSTPAYMLGKDIAEVEAGILQLTKAVVDLA